MKLISVSNGRKTAWADVVNYTVVADLEDGAGVQTLDFSYSSSDMFGLAPQLGEYLATNAVPVVDYVAPPLEASAGPTEGQLLATISDAVDKLRTMGIAI